ncbi:MAG: helix-turn-helix domain-containing protein [Candidatus Jettenia sp.]|nr:MAG: helix-turn-helix domain-containing protein [Candidatus Jettenia sp.]UJS17865.1 MAG: helix-turn-helix domain-containing protein [Candidatus Jettenia sp.]
MTEEGLGREKLYTLGQVVEILNVPKYRIVYLFDSRKLRGEDFLKSPGGERVYRESDIEKIRRALFEVGNK